MAIKNLLIYLTSIIGFIVLFFFPEPESNFLLYIGTAVIFIILIIVLAITGRRK